MPEQIGILLLFLVVILFNFVIGYLRHRREREAAPKKAERDAGQPPVPTRVPARAAMTPARIDEPPPVRWTPPPPVRPPRRRLQLRHGDLRRAVVLMTVLGPPRALEHEARDVSGGR